MMRNRTLLALLIVLMVNSVAYASSCKQLVQAGKMQSASVQCAVEARQGSAEAQFLLGSIYCFGQGVAEDCKLGEKWLQKSASQGYVNAMFTLAARQLADQSPAVQKQGMALMNKAAEAGSADAAMFLGNAYFNGAGVERDRKAGMQWYMTAAERGHPLAQFRIGLAYLSGNGMVRDDSQGILWVNKAAEQNLPDALYVLGLSYINGEASLDRNYDRGMAMLRKAARLGNVQALNYVNQNDL